MLKYHTDRPVALRGMQSELIWEFSFLLFPRVQECMPCGQNTYRHPFLSFFFHSSRKRIWSSDFMVDVRTFNTVVLSWLSLLVRWILVTIYNKSNSGTRLEVTTFPNFHIQQQELRWLYYSQQNTKDKFIHTYYFHFKFEKNVEANLLGWRHYMHKAHFNGFARDAII